MRQVGIIYPSEFSPANSIEVVIWVAVGGRGTLWGAVLGAVLVNWGKSYFTGAFPDAWLYLLCVLLVFTTLFLPKGIVGTVPEVWEKIRLKVRPRNTDLAASKAGEV